MIHIHQKNWFLALLVLPSMLTLTWWILSKNLPTSDSLHFFDTCQWYVSHVQSDGADNFFKDIRHLDKALLNTLLCAPIVALFGPVYFIVIGILNSVFVGMMVVALYTFARLYISEALAILFSFVVVSLSWIVYEATLFEAQLLFAVAAVVFVCSHDCWWRGQGYKWPVIMGLAAATAILARPVEGFLFVLVFMVVNALAVFLSGQRRRRREMTASLVVASVVAAPWLWLTYPALEKWVFQGLHQQVQIGPFFIRSASGFAVFESYLKEFLGVPGLILVGLVVMSWFFYRKGSMLTWKERYTVLLPLFVYAVMFPLMVTLFVGTKNPVYYFVSYICMYMLFVPFLVQTGMQRIVGWTLCLILICNLTFVASSVGGWSWILRKQQRLLRFHVSHIDALLHQHPGYQLVEKVQKHIDLSQIQTVSTILFRREGFDLIENGTLKAASVNTSPQIIWQKCLFWGEHMQGVSDMCDWTSSNYLLVGPIDTSMKSEVLPDGRIKNLIQGIISYEKQPEEFRGFRRIPVSSHKSKKVAWYYLYYR